MTTLADGLQEEIKRNIELVSVYRSIGPMGILGATMIHRDIDEAVKAAIEGDCVKMIDCFQKLQGNE